MFNAEVYTALQFKKKINVVNQLNKYLTRSIIFVLLVIAKTSYAQFHPIVDRFDVFEASGKVYVSCVISSGSTCNGVDVLCSEDSTNFITVGQIGGVCGSSSEPIAYNFIDENPIRNKRIYYKLELGGYHWGYYPGPNPDPIYKNPTTFNGYRIK